MDVFSRIAPILLASNALIASVSAPADAHAEEDCECTVEVGTQNRKIWGSWALECSGHAGHDDCPTTNIDSLHTPGESAMTGSVVIEALSAGVVHDSWKKTFLNDHVTAFKGPVWDGKNWFWTNTCSCDGYHRKACDGSPQSQWTDYFSEMYSGAQRDHAYVRQGKSKPLVLPGRCGRSDQALVVHERIQEHDPFTPADKLGTLSVRVRPQEGTRTRSIWAQHFEPAFDSSGKRTHAGYSGGYFGAEIVLEVSCRTG